MNSENQLENINKIIFDTIVIDNVKNSIEELLEEVRNAYEKLEKRNKQNLKLLEISIQTNYGGECLLECIYDNSNNGEVK